MLMNWNNQHKKEWKLNFLSFLCHKTLFFFNIFNYWKYKTHINFLSHTGTDNRLNLAGDPGFADPALVKLISHSDLINHFPTLLCTLRNFSLCLNIFWFFIIQWINAPIEEKKIWCERLMQVGGWLQSENYVCVIIHGSAMSEEFSLFFSFSFNSCSSTIVSILSPPHRPSLLPTLDPTPISNLSMCPL